MTRKSYPIKIEGKAFIVSIGSLGTFNFEIKKTHSSKTKISLWSHDEVNLLKSAIKKYERVKELNDQIEQEAQQETDSEKPKLRSLLGRSY